MVYSQRVPTTSFYCCCFSSCCCSSKHISLISKKKMMLLNHTLITVEHQSFGLFPPLLPLMSLCQTTIQGMSPWPPPTSQRSPAAFSPHPQPPPLTPASCSLGLVAMVSVLVELCDVGGKRDGGGGGRVECCSSGGGDGLKVILISFTSQTQ